MTRTRRNQFRQDGRRCGFPPAQVEHVLLLMETFDEIEELLAEVERALVREPALIEVWRTIAPENSAGERVH
jgi:hypothetical protein